MPKNTSKDTTNVKDSVSLTVDDALGRGGYKAGKDEPRNRTGVKDGELLTPDEQVLVRTEPSAATKADSKYRHRFTVTTDRGVNAADVDWSDEQYTNMHEANKVAVLQFALGAGLHPQGTAEFEGCVAGTGRSGVLVYAVEVVPATMSSAPETVSPRKALLEMDGNSTFVGDDGNIGDSPASDKPAD